MDSLSDIDNLPLLRLYHLDTSPIARFRSLLRNALEEAVDQLPGLEQEWREGEEIVREELGRVHDLGSAVLLVALFQELESRLKECLEEAEIRRHNDVPRDARREHRSGKAPPEAIKKSGLSLPSASGDRLDKRVRGVIGEMKELDGYHAFDELRLAVNAWKHNGGVVTPQLAKKAPKRWGKTGDWMTNMGEAYDALLPGVRTFAHALCLRLKDLRE